MNLAILLGGILLWFIAGCVASYYARKWVGKGMAEYFIANRRIGGLVSAMTYSATTYSAFMMVGLVGLTYKTGVTSLGFELTYLMATVFLLTLFAPRFWIAGKKYGYITPSELLSDRYENKWVGAIAAILSLVMLIPYASVQLMGMGYLIEALSGGALPFVVGSAIAAVISFIYSWWAGMRSVAWTDTIQAFIMLIASLILLGFVLTVFFPQGFISTVETETPKLLTVTWPFSLFIGLALPWAFFALTNPQVAQRLYIPKDVRSMKHMILGFSIFGFIYTIITTLLGFAAANIIPGLKVADKAMPMLLTKVPDILAIAVLVGILAAAVSTLNSIILTLSSMFARDVIKALKPEIDEDKELLSGKLLIPVITLICFAFAQFKFGLIAILSAMASGGLLMMLPAILGAFFWKRGTAAGAISSMAIGGIVVGAMYILKLKPLGQWPTIWGIILAAVIFIGVSLATTPPKKASEFVEYVNKTVRDLF